MTNEGTQCACVLSKRAYTFAIRIVRKPLASNWFSGLVGVFGSKRSVQGESDPAFFFGKHKGILSSRSDQFECSSSFPANLLRTSKVKSANQSVFQCASKNPPSIGD
ncbi:hypothetical protein AVEN_121616-1 [Araneus ventricosus]|uniref:Uncharacterized protein n=1 Tax=Araneus ventricosus TaxID=182803 RepID=A0A4Y2N4M6_ARAVE|nr:hypothetical protein AVEN_121616-1 [Araneus ventricosus]